MNPNPESSASPSSEIQTAPFKLRDWLFLLLFAAIYGLLHFAYFQIPDEVLRDVVHYHGLVKVSAGLIDLLAPVEHVAALQNHIISPLANLEVVRGCDGSGAMFLIVAAVLAFPASVVRKLVGIAASLALMYVLNLVRIVSIYFVVAYYPAWFLPAHTYFAPTLIVLLGCLFFAWWALWATRRKHGSA